MKPFPGLCLLAAALLSTGLGAAESTSPAEIGLRIGQHAPAFTLHDQNGKEVSLDALLKKGPVALVLGAEGSGMRQLTSRTCDELVRLPMKGAVESLNVSVASGICLYEALRQREAAIE